MVKAVRLAHMTGTMNLWSQSSNALLLAAFASAALFLSQGWRKWTLALAGLFLSVLLFGDALHYRFFREVIGVHELFYSTQVFSFWESVIPAAALG